MIIGQRHHHLLGIINITGYFHTDLVTFICYFFCLGFVQICNRLADLAFLYKNKTNVTVNVLLFYPCVALFSHKSLCSAVFLNN